MWCDIRIRQPPRELHAGNTLVLYRPHVSLDFQRHSFPALWNSIPAAIRDSVILDTFNILIRHLLNCAYSPLTMITLAPPILCATQRGVYQINPFLYSVWTWGLLQLEEIESDFYNRRKINILTCFCRSSEVRLLTETGIILIERSHLTCNSGIPETLLAHKSSPPLQEYGRSATIVHPQSSLANRE